jgi:RND family efflux transporter MFP subunit
MTLQRRHIVIVAVTLIVAVALLMKRPLRNAHAKDSDEPAQRLAPVILAVRGPIQNVITLSGEFRPFQVVDVHAKVAGYIREIYVDVGDKVGAGQVLAVLEVPELSAQVMGAQADIRRSEDAVQRAQSEIERAQSGHQAYHAAYTRLKQASESRPGLIAEQELDDAMAKDKETDAQINSARAALAESQNQLGMAKATLERLSALKAYSRITAPFAGVVTERYADPGALIQAGTASSTQSLPLVRLSQNDRLRLEIPVSVSYVSRVNVGDSVEIRIPSLEKSFAGTIARSSRKVETATRTMKVEVDVPNPDLKLIPGMYASVLLHLDRRPNALVVPVQGVSRAKDSSAFVVDQEGRVEERPVTLGLETPGKIEVLSGLREGDLVMIGSRTQVKPGQIVHPTFLETAQRTP